MAAIITNVTAATVRRRNLTPGRRVRVRRPIDNQSWRAEFVSANVSPEGELRWINVCDRRTGGLYSVAAESIVRVHN